MGTFAEDDGCGAGHIQGHDHGLHAAQGAWTSEDAINGNAASIPLIPEVYGDLENSGLTATMAEEPRCHQLRPHVKQTPKKKAKG